MSYPNLSASTEPQAQSALSALAERINSAHGRVNVVTAQLNQIAFNLHGPRPQEISKDAAANKPADSLRGQIEFLLASINDLEAATQSIVR